MGKTARPGTAAPRPRAVTPGAGIAAAPPGPGGVCSGLPFASEEEDDAIERDIQEVGIHRAFCAGWKRREPCGECDRLLTLANAARARVGLGPREDPPWAASAPRSTPDSTVSDTTIS